MIQKLNQTENYRSFLDTRTGDVIMQGAVNTQLIGMSTGETVFLDPYWEVVIRGNQSGKHAPGSVSGHINHKRGIARVLKGDPGYDTDESLSETELDGIIRDYRSADIRNNS